MRPVIAFVPFGAFAAFAAFAMLAPAADDAAKLLPPGPGRDVVGGACLGCHPADNFRRLRLTRDEWADKVADMVEQGAKANDAEQEAIVGYLTATFGKESKVYVNTAPFIELRLILGFTIPETEALVAYRKEHGDFKEWRELLKVSGLDPAKVQAKKDIMIF